MVYWGFHLNHVYYLHSCFKDFKLSWEYISQSDFTWECLGLTSLHSPTLVGVCLNIATLSQPTSILMPQLLL